MATLPKPKMDANLQQIDINLQGQADQPDIVIQGVGDSISFYNGAPFPVVIEFICANGPVFNNISRIEHDSPQSGPAQYPQKTQITTDYQIRNLNTNAVHGPYGIQVGTSPSPAPALLIPIVSGNPSYPNMQTVSVPQAGSIQFSLDVKYTITWKPVSNVFNTPAPPNTIGPGLTSPYQAQLGNQVNSATYTLVSANDRGVTGGGGVHINS
jgi:hypothetical protein